MSVAAPSQPTALTAEQVQEFQQNGFLILRQLASVERCAAIRELALSHLECGQEPVEFEADLAYPGAPASRSAQGGLTIRRLRAAYQRDPLLQAWAHESALTDKVSQLLGAPISLTLAHHNCIMSKYPDYGTATGWHRDIRYWSFEQPDLICTWLALGTESEHNGGLHFIPGSHACAIKPEQLDAVDFLITEHSDSAALLAKACTVTLEAGDVVLFHSKLFHAAGRNNSDTVKLSMVFAYHAQHNAPVPGSRSAQGGSVAI